MDHYCSWAHRHHHSLCYGLNVCVPPNLYVEVLMPSGMVSGGEAFGPEGGALMNGISAPIKDPTELPPLLCQASTQ